MRSDMDHTVLPANYTMPAEIVYPGNRVTHLRKKRTVSWPGIEPENQKSQVLGPNRYTTEPPGYMCSIILN